MKFSLRFLSLVVFSVVFVSQAQIIYKHNFDAPTGAFLVDSDGDAFAWALHDFQDGEGMVATSNNIFSPIQPQRADNWLICGPVDLSAASRPYLYWKAKASGAIHTPEKLKLYVFTDLPMTAQNTILTDEIDTSAVYKETFTMSAEGGYRNHQIDLSELKGEDSVYVAFRHQSDSPVFGLNLDDLVISDVVNSSMDISIVEPSRAYFSEGLGNEVHYFKTLSTPDDMLQLSFKIGNYGSEFSGGEFAYTINGVHQSIALSTSIARNDQKKVDMSLGLGAHKITAKVIDTSGRLVSEKAVYHLKVSEPVPDIRITDTYGNAYRLYDELRSGKTILLDFFASWCGPCEISTPKINKLWDSFGRGASSFQVFGVTTDPQDSYSVINNLDWGAEYPKFAASNQTKRLYDHFERTVGGQDAIPFFLMICPDKENPAYSKISWFSNGWSDDDEVRQAALSCNASLSVVDRSESKPFSLFPNPASQQTYLELNLESRGQVDIKVFNNLGQAVYLKNTIMSAGTHRIELPLELLDSGLHYVQLKSNYQVFTEKLHVVK